MYTQIWAKYLPVIRILLKRSVNGQQWLDLNRSDFERAGVARKSGYKFHIHFSKGRVDNIISASQLAKDLAQVLLEDKTVKEAFMQNDYHIDMNVKFQLGISFFSLQPLEAQLQEDENGEQKPEEVSAES